MRAEDVEARLTDAELDEAFEIARDLRSLRLTAALSELKERRKADLTEAELHTLCWASGAVRFSTWADTPAGPKAVAESVRIINRIRVEGYRLLAPTERALPGRDE